MKSDEASDEAAKAVKGMVMEKSSYMDNANSQNICEPVFPNPVGGFPDFGHINLQGVLNCRDLGGMPAEGHKTVKRRRLIRSGDLHNADATDINQLIDMHDMECIVDFRTDAEVENDPDPLPLLQGIEYVHLSVLDQNDIVALFHVGFGGETRLLREFMHDPFETIQGLYDKAMLGERGISAYKAFLDKLLESEKGATLWHCTQGKDRTGVAAILVESALGVPQEVIREDYLATNLFVSGWIARMKKLFEDKKLTRGIESDIEAYAYASPCYFDAVFKIADDMYGSMKDYMREVLDFGEDKRKKLQELYLE